MRAMRSNPVSRFASVQHAIKRQSHPHNSEQYCANSDLDSKHARAPNCQDDSTALPGTVSTVNQLIDPSVGLPSDYRKFTVLNGRVMDRGGRIDDLK